MGEGVKQLALRAARFSSSSSSHLQKGRRGRWVGGAAAGYKDVLSAIASAKNSAIFS